MITKVCPRCGKRLTLSERCSCYSKRYQDDKHDSDFDRFYQSIDWKTAKKLAKKRFHGIDVYEWYKSGLIVYGKTVHHIEPIKDNWEKRLDKDNLIYLCESNHRIIHKMLENEETRAFIIAECHKAVNEFLTLFGDNQTRGDRDEKNNS